jgi:hypothetical protein
METQSKSIYIVTCNNGDGSNFLEWHQTMSAEKQEQLVALNTTRYASRNDFEVKELKVPINFNLKYFAEVNSFTWFDDSQLKAEPEATT